MPPVILHALALKDASLEPLAPAGFLTGVEGYTRDSARAFLLAQPGFLGRGLELEAARRLQSSAAAAGFETVLAREEELPVLPPAIKTSRIEFREDGFSAVTPGAVQDVKFADVSFITAAAFDAPLPPPNLDAIKKDPVFEKIMSLAGEPPFKLVSESGSRETFFRAYVLAEDGSLRLLLEPENLDFSPLGPSRSHSSLVNFRELLKLLSARCPGAAANAFLPALLAHKHLAQLKLAGPQACDVELTRLLLVKPRG